MRIPGKSIYKEERHESIEEKSGGSFRWKIGRA